MAHVVVIGAGVVGAMAALNALSEGFEVSIMEPATPGGEQAASYGNGCWLSPMSVIPPATPGTWKKVPQFLADPLGPLAVNWRYLPRALPWLAGYLLAGATEARVMKHAEAIAPLLRGAPAIHKAIADEAGVGHLIHQRGAMYIYPNRAAFKAEALAWRVRRRVGIEWREIEAEELRQREPDLDRRYGFGVLVEAAGHCTDPGGYTAALVALAEAKGAKRISAAATGFRIEGGRLKAVRSSAGEVPADRAVIAAGIRSKPLAKLVGDNVPLESERGYHAVLLGDAGAYPRTPLMPSDGKMGVVMTEAGLRASGQVEIAGIEAEPNWKRAEILRDHLLSSFPGLPRDLPADRFKFWMGHRPSTTDGLPVIGASRECGDVLHAFGHGHTGLVGSARTGRAIGALLARRAPEIDLRPFSAARF
ncbi:FAD-dependent oxidoreductase [Acetobacteraceae bacterium H6797]|nr:FAD-dependent oxidoreductase [Acetobacteraceae bacterium H6797]